MTQAEQFQAAFEKLLNDATATLYAEDDYSGPARPIDDTYFIRFKDGSKVWSEDLIKRLKDYPTTWPIIK